MCSVAKLCPTVCDPTDYVMPGLPLPHHLPELAQVHVHRIQCYSTISSSVSLFSFCFQSFPASGSFHQAVCIRWPKYWRFSFKISPSNEYSGLIAFRIDWFDLLAGWGILKSLLQLHNSKASILGGSAFLMIQLSHSYVTLEKPN